MQDTILIKNPKLNQMFREMDTVKQLQIYKTISKMQTMPICLDKSIISVALCTMLLICDELKAQQEAELANNLDQKT